ncbi:MAG: biopolymer transporter ExbD [Bdellovibrionaceae bacterium]|nr:biopolymer transporter ExbD [Pseudobdellovibrionaceae bacterium]
MGASLGGGSSDDPIAEINIVPFVDIILVVLIIFMVTAPLVLKPAIDISLPQASSGEAKETEKNLDVLIASNGDLYVNGQPSDLDKLKAEATNIAMKAVDSGAILNADKAVTLEKLTEVIDTIKLAGVKKVAFSIQKK